jgi:subtilisin-like proprotein convertase family protein
MNEETIMNATLLDVSSRKRGWGLPRPRTMATKIAVGVLATTLIASSAIPAFAGKPHHDRQSPRHEQQQTQDVDAAGKHKGNKNKSKTVTKTFANGSAIAIPALDLVEEFGPADPYPSTIAVSGFKKAKITDLNLMLRGFSHEFPRDVDVLLVAPGGRNVVVMGDVGGASQSPDAENLTITLDDEAATPLSIADDVALTNGSFQPLDNMGLADGDAPNLTEFPAPAPAPSGDTGLVTFDGINPNGEWQLFVLDDVVGDAGSLADGWTLEITAKAKAKSKNKKR